MKNFISFIHAASKLTTEGKVKIPDRKVRIALDQLLGCLDAFFVFAEGGVQHCAQESVRMNLARMSLHPQLTGL